MKIAVLGLGSAGRRHAEHLTALGHEPIGFDPLGGGVASESEAVAGADAVVVASPNSLHAEQASRAIAMGRPVLVEKPMCAEVDDAERLVVQGQDAGVVAGVAMNLRFHPAIVALKELVGAGKLGELRLARCSFGYDLRLWRPGTDYRRSYSARRDLGGGMLLDAIHELDYLLWLLGPAEAVSARLGRVSDLEIDVEDTVLAAITFASGAMAALDLNFHEPAYRRGLVLVGADAVADWDWNADAIAVRAGTEVNTIPLARDLSATYRAELVDFLAAVAGGPPPRATLADGLAALRLADAIRRSAELGARIRVAAGGSGAALTMP